MEDNHVEPGASEAFDTLLEIVNDGFHWEYGVEHHRCGELIGNIAIKATGKYWTKSLYLAQGTASTHDDYVLVRRLVSIPEVMKNG